MLDAQDDPYTDALQKLHETIIRANKYNPNIFFEVFIHKVDGDLFLSDEQKVDCQRDIHEQIYAELRERDLDHIQVEFQLTSIYDHSVFEAFSKVVDIKLYCSCFFCFTYLRSTEFLNALTSGLHLYDQD